MKELITTLYEANVYYIFHILGMLGELMCFWVLSKKTGIPRVRSIVFAIPAASAAYIWMLVLTWAENGFQYFGAQNVVRLYVWLPLFIVGFAKLFKINSTIALGIAAVGHCVFNGVGKLACIFSGCCYGYPSERFGIWNPWLQEYRFPVQILECVVLLVIAISLLAWYKKLDYKMPITAFPIMMIAFGVTRFFLEFLRDNAKIRWGISWLACHAALCALVGGIWLAVIMLRRKKAAQTVTAVK